MNQMELKSPEKVDELFKIILAGDTGVGKTNLVHKFVKGAEKSVNNIGPTIGVNFATKVVQLQGGKIVKSQIWDTAGQEQYRAITKAHYRRALGAIVVFDLTKPRSFESVRSWVESIKEQADPNVVIVLVANKIDLKDELAIKTQDARKTAQELQIFYQETSAKLNINVENTFLFLLEEINRRRKDNPQQWVGEGFQLGETDNQNKCDC